jgi:hypothetical protein
MVKQAYLDGYMAHHQDPWRWIMAGDFSWDFLWKNEWNIVEINRLLWFFYWDLQEVYQNLSG